MATIKSYTDISQSRKLAEILPLERADMCYRAYREEGGILDYQISLCPYQLASWIGVPCWSLAALLDIMPKHIKQNDERTYKFHIFNDDGIVIQRWGCSYVAKDYHNRAEYLSDPKLKYPTNIYSGKYEDILDACIEMIYKLKERDLI